MTIRDIYSDNDIRFMVDCHIIDSEIIRSHYGDRDELIGDIKLRYAYYMAESLVHNWQNDYFNRIYEAILHTPFDEILKHNRTKGALEKWQNQLLFLSRKRA